MLWPPSRAFCKVVLLHTCTGVTTAGFPTACGQTIVYRSSQARPCVQYYNCVGPAGLDRPQTTDNPTPETSTPTETPGTTTDLQITIRPYQSAWLAGLREHCDCREVRRVEIFEMFVSLFVSGESVQQSLCRVRHQKPGLQCDIL